MAAITATDAREITRPVGQLLREWRSARGMSQLDLALRAGFSARHIMTLGTPHDVTLQELRVETFFPADEASELRWSTMIPHQ